MRDSERGKEGKEEDESTGRRGDGVRRGEGKQEEMRREERRMEEDRRARRRGVRTTMIMQATYAYNFG